MKLSRETLSCITILGKLYVTPGLSIWNILLRATEQWGSVLSNLHLPVGKQAVRSFDINKSPLINSPGIHPIFFGGVTFDINGERDNGKPLARFVF